ncbi:MAG TPA: signal peptide peptidase SppA [Tepidisphaeraceae bacterium]
MPRRSAFLRLVVIVALVLWPGWVRGADEPQPKKATIPVFALKGEITESPVDESFPLFEPPGVSLGELTKRMTQAAKDGEVKAVVVLDEGGMYGSAQVEEMRQAMGALRAAGKEVYVHSDSLRMPEYVLFAGASRVSAVPTADVWVTGLYAEQPYLRGLLDKIGVQPDFLTCGEYKSAAEIFVRDQPSKQADEMINWLLDSMYQTDLKLIARGRKVSVEQARTWIDGGPYSAGKAKAAGLIDAIEHRQDFNAFLKKKHGNNVEFDRRYGQPKQPTIDFNNPFAVFKLMADLFGGTKKPKSDRPAVGIVYVEGPILLGEQVPSMFGMMGGQQARSSAIRKALDRAAADDQVKAVVLRVNSPGGSAVASEIILDATRRVKAKKPFVVSMGNVAGSGGYYVSCASDTIFADRSTITASIGVVAGKLVTTPMWNKVGITFKPYGRGRHAGLLNTDKPFSKDEREVVQAWMDEIYATFRKHVTDARGERLKKPLEEIAGGRVYTGQQALELGLVDRIGTLGDAIAFVAGEAKLKEGEYDTRPVPEAKNFIEQLMEQSGGGEKDPGNVAGVRGSVLQLAMPYLQHLDPQRVMVIRQALLRLDLIQNEGPILMMPEVGMGR